MLGPAKAGRSPMFWRLMLGLSKWKRFVSHSASCVGTQSVVFVREFRLQERPKPLFGLDGFCLKLELVSGGQRLTRHKCTQAARLVEDAYVASEEQYYPAKGGEHVQQHDDGFVLGNPSKIHLLRTCTDVAAFRRSLRPDRTTLLSILRACSMSAALDKGKVVHDYVAEIRLDTDVGIGNALIAMYASCGSLASARQVFDSLRAKDAVSWDRMISAYANAGLLDLAVELVLVMHQKGMHTRKGTLIRILKACSNIDSVAQGRLIHSHMLEAGSVIDVFVASTLIHMYSKCGSLCDARNVFDAMPSRDVVSWNTMIAAYAEHGDGQEAIQLFLEMGRDDTLSPDRVTLLSLLKACSAAGAFEQGKLIHTHDVVMRRLESDVFIGNTLIDMYAKCGSLEDACGVFQGMLSIRDQVTWTAMIAGYVQHGYVKDALQLFQQMQQQKDIRPSKVTVMSILKACSNGAALDEGKMIHDLIIASGFGSDTLVCNSLMDMYGKCGNLAEARGVFDRLGTKDVVSWNVMISAYAESGDWDAAIRLFQRMQEEEGIEADKYTLVGVLKACSNLAALEWGKLIHGLVTSSGVDSDFVANTLIHMYGSCGCMGEAHKLFAKLWPSRHLVSWTAMIAGYAEDGDGQQALELFWDMLREGIFPDKVALVSILKACSSVAALSVGKMIHSHALEYGMESDLTLRNSVIDMYAKCGSLEDARQVFDKTWWKRDVVSWNAMISGYAQHGGGVEALEVFEQMQQEGVHPDDITFRSLLSACSHAGLLEDGIRLFGTMHACFSVSPQMQHYVCMVDLFCRSGCLDEAEDMIKAMPWEADPVVWMPLLAACRTQGNLELARRAFEAIMRSNTRNASPYILMAEIYGDAGMAEDGAQVRREMHSVGVKKEAGRSWMEFGDEVHNFVADDERHPQRKAVYSQLKTLMQAVVPNRGTGPSVGPSSVTIDE